MKSPKIGSAYLPDARAAFAAGGYGWFDPTD